ncbi:MULTISPECIES: hypothetical protein [unclassified Wolbachia]|uniref:hypothetical protein n=1 Tax=unclassified Wolbachia TaxID=2640676 RepID=UPI002231B5B4|nr:hypothetical protein [Wolbachia endosymbiont (group A) of Apoderus coryli]
MLNTTNGVIPVLLFLSSQSGIQFLLPGIKLSFLDPSSLGTGCLVEIYNNCVNLLYTAPSFHLRFALLSFRPF